MSRLIYTAQTSLDGYTVDADGSFAWAEPDAEVHGFYNRIDATLGTHLYGRRLYEVMKVWQDMPEPGETSPEVTAYADIWRAAEKVVYSGSLPVVTTPRTRLERMFDPVAVRALVAEATQDVSIGGATLAGDAIRAGLVDVWHQFVYPVVVGGGTRWLPGDVRVDLELVDEHRFASGVVHLQYRSRG